MFVSGLKLQARAAARRAGFTFLGTVFLLIGIGFLTAAAWIVLSEMRDPLFAALVLGGVFVGLGLIFFGISMSRYVRVRVAAPPPPAGTHALAYALPALAEAFMMGISAGSATRGRRSDR
jgi:hypothetical protein